MTKWFRFYSPIDNPNVDIEEYDVFYVETDTERIAKRVLDIMFSDCGYVIDYDGCSTNRKPIIENVKYYFEHKFVTRVINADEIRELHLLS